MRVNVETMKTILGYMYTTVVDIDIKNIADIQNASEKLGIFGLINLCMIYRKKLEEIKTIRQNRNSLSWEKDNTGSSGDSIKGQIMNIGKK
ncbi:unnamed protein product [Gordionus sp. m RMFG-2023]